MKKADIVKQIVDCLFTSGRGDEATRLVLELPGKKDGGGWCRRAVEDQIDQVLTACDLPFLDEDFLILMNEIGRWGHELHSVDPLLSGNRARLIRRHQKERILNHARQHITDYENGILHDHFGDASHQLAAAAFNLLMEFYFSQGE